MAVCKQCGNPVGLFAQLCVDCLAESKRAAAELQEADARAANDPEAIRAARKLLAESKSIELTTETVLPNPSLRRLGIVTGTCIYGQHMGRDVMASLTDVVGGRSKTSENLYRQARNQALDDLRVEAAQLGASMVFAVTIDQREISSGGKSMIMVTAVGTAATEVHKP